MQYYTLDDVRAILEQWGCWSRCKIGTEYPNVNMLHIQRCSELTASCELLLDDAALQRLDRAIAALRIGDEYAVRMNRVLKARYIAQRRSHRALAEAMKMQRQQAQIELGIAIGWVAAIINTQVA